MQDHHCGQDSPTSAPAPVTVTRNHNPQIAETDFEKRRGVSRVENRGQLSQVQVEQLHAPLPAARLEVLRLLAEQGINIDFLKLTTTGLAFMVNERDAESVRNVLDQGFGQVEVLTGRSLLLIHAVNMRDEEGLIARIVALCIAAGMRIEHLGDMHDRLMMVTDDESARALVDLINQEAEAGRL